MMMCFSLGDHIGLQFRINTTAGNRFSFSDQCFCSLFMVSKLSSPYLSESRLVKIFKC